MSRPGLAPRLAATWVRTYTRRLPAEIAAGRRAEVASDLHEHRGHTRAAGRSDVRYGFEVMGRVARGVPADLAWRRSARRSQPTTRGVAVMQRLTNFAGTAVMMLAAIGVAMSVAMIPVVASVDDPGDLLWIVALGVFAAALVAGLVMQSTRPGLATILFVLGSPAPAVAWFWLPPVYLLSLAIVLAALVDYRGTRLQPSHP
jgi:hypothetical protein